MPDTSVRINLLKKSHLFRGIGDTELASIAGAMKAKTYEESELVFAQDEPADSFYFVFNGQVQVVQNGKQIANLYKGDYFGEMGLLKGNRRTATAKALPGTTLLILYREDFKTLLKNIKGLYENFDLMIDSRQLANNLRFDWLQKNEIIYFLARKHYFLLIRSLSIPALLVIPVLFLAGSAYMLSSAGMGLLSGLLAVGTAAWGTWKYLDWGNDYYIVTNQRAIWLEKVIGLYESRREAPMTTILSVNTETDQFGRIFGYGAVVVRTYTGQIRMDFIRNPRQAAAMIEEYWNRTKEVARQHDEEIIKDAIRARLGVKKPAAPAPATPAPAPAAAPAPKKPENPLSTFWRDTFQMRYENGGTVIYRKHWFVFLRDTAPQGITFLITLAGLIAYPIVAGIPPAWLILSAFIVLAVVFGWWAYGLLDWKNDNYQVTADQIIDVYKKPFGTEDRKAAPLDGILSSSFRREGVIENLLNYGTVYIEVGGAHFDFVDVADPPAVHEDIIRRMQVLMLKKHDNETAAERKRMAEWLAMYHSTLQEIEKEQKQKSG